MRAAITIARLTTARAMRCPERACRATGVRRQTIAEIVLDDGWIEFVHTERSVPSILDGFGDVDRPLRPARIRTALEDQHHVGRCLDLIDREGFAEVEAEREERRGVAALTVAVPCSA